MANVSEWACTRQWQLPSLSISHDTLDYFPNDFPTRETRLPDRHEKLTAPEYIKLRLIDFELVYLGKTTAVTQFTLIHERPDYPDETLKQLILTNQNGLVLIKQENNLRVTPLP